MDLKLACEYENGRSVEGVTSGFATFETHDLILLQYVRNGLLVGYSNADQVQLNLYLYE